MGKVLSGIVYFFLFLMLVVSGILVVPAYRKYRQTLQEVETLQADLDRVKGEYLTLQQEVHDLQHNASAIEKVAREQYHLSREGEVIYIYSECFHDSDSLFRRVRRGGLLRYSAARRRRPACPDRDRLRAGL